MPRLARMELNYEDLPLKHEEPDTFFAEELPDDDVSCYRSRPQLPESSVFKRSLQWLIQQLETQQIDVDPEYQREVVWTADRMTGLVNSLMENYYIPPIILSRKNRNRMVCVDGKQRLSSVRAFKEGLIPCNDHCGEKWWYFDNSVGGKRKVLPEAIRQQFLQKELVSFEFENLSPDQEEDLFARVQMGVQLTAAEKMRASTGPWQELARMFVDDFPVIFSLLKDRSRAKDFQIALSCFSQILEVQNFTPANGTPVLRTNYQSLPKFLKNKDAVDDGIKSHLASVFTIFRDLVEQDLNTFTNSNNRLKGVQTFAPIELIAVTCLISQHSDTRNNKLLLGDILTLRENLREHFVDLRTNVSTWKHIWEYIDKLESIRGAVDGTNVNRDVDVRSASKTLSPAAQQPIVAPAAPVAKRGQPTTRTKLAKVAPGSMQATAAPRHKSTPVQVTETTTVKLDEECPAPSIEPPHKRTKIDQNRTGNHPSHTSRPVTSGAGSSTEGRVVLDDLESLDLPLHHKKPSPPVATVPQPPKVQRARRSVQAPLPVLAGALKSGSGRALLPEQARRERIAAYTGNTPNAPMVSPTSKSKGPAPATNESRKFSLNTTPQAGDQYQELPNVTDVTIPIALHRRRKSTGLVPQANGAIDLTNDDVEQERQNLLIQFSASKKSKSKSKLKASVVNNEVGIRKR